MFLSEKADIQSYIREEKDWEDMKLPSWIQTSEAVVTRYHLRPLGHWDTQLFILNQITSSSFLCLHQEGPRKRLF